jgi:transcriptional regulator with XRE-family HTH domain
MPKNAEVIRRARKALGLKREHVAVRGDVPYDTVVRAEQHGNISWTTANKLARVLKLDPADLMPEPGPSQARK